jgi:hypothetical protein
MANDKATLIITLFKNIQVQTHQIFYKAFFSGIGARAPLYVWCALASNLMKSYFFMLQ